jgi:hypothetical protein
MNFSHLSPHSPLLSSPLPSDADATSSRECSLDLRLVNTTACGSGSRRHRISSVKMVRKSCLVHHSIALTRF